jgi:hypothetical protein
MMCDSSRANDAAYPVFARCLNGLPKGGCANEFWHSLAIIVAGVCDPGPSRTAGLTDAGYKNPGRQNPLAYPEMTAVPCGLFLGAKRKCAERSQLTMIGSTQ